MSKLTTTYFSGYYPYGLPWASMQGQESRLYSGKELERMHALNLYDFHARLYDPQLGRFLSPDPCSTQYEPLSPYLYCAANPILLTDPTGMRHFFSRSGEHLIDDNDDDEMCYMLVGKPGKGKTIQDKWAPVIERKEYVAITESLIEGLEQASKLSEDNDVEYGFYQKEDGSITSLTTSNSPTVVHDRDWKIIQDELDGKPFLTQVHTHPSNYNNKTINRAEPSEQDLATATNKIEILLAFRVSQQKVDEGSSASSTVGGGNVFKYSFIPVILFYNKNWTQKHPQDLKDFTKAATKILNYYKK